MNKNMIESCGTEWCNRRVSGGHFLHDGKVLRADNFGRRVVECVEVSTGKDVQVPAEVFTGFRVFMYPRLGYRRDPKTGVVVFMRRANSYDRGLRPRRVRLDISPACAALGREPDISDATRMVMAFSPSYDDIAAVREVISGDRISAVLDEDVLVEPSMDENGRSYTVYYRTVVAATISVDSVIKWRTDAYARLLSHYFKDL